MLGAEKASKNSDRSGEGDHPSRWKRLAWVNVLRTSIDQGFPRGRDAQWSSKEVSALRSDTSFKLCVRRPTVLANLRQVVLKNAIKTVM